MVLTFPGISSHTDLVSICNSRPAQKAQGFAFTDATGSAAIPAERWPE
jgi:hypothetical protein